jgi:hypothetical protein
LVVSVDGGSGNSSASEFHTATIQLFDTGIETGQGSTGAPAYTPIMERIAGGVEQIRRGDAGVVCPLLEHDQVLNVTDES